MTSSRVMRLSLVILVLAFIATTASAQIGSVVANWTVPSTWSPSSDSGGLHHARTLVDVTNALPFIGVTPCRIVDTRGPAGPFGAPSLPASTPRSFTLPSGPCTGIPSGVASYSLNITVTNTLGPGFISLYPTGGSAPVVSTLNYVFGQTIANAAIVPAGTSGAITAIAGVSGTDLIIDINGYFPTGSSPINPNESFSLTGNFAGGAIIQGENLQAAAADSLGGLFISHSGGPRSAGVKGIGNLAFGVFGQTQTLGASGVRGRLIDSVSGNTLANGFLAASNNSTGIGSRGVFGFTLETGHDTAGIEGQAADVLTPGTGLPAAGVRGESEVNVGVLGVSTSGAGVAGYLKNGIAGGLGVSNFMADGSTQDWGVLALGDIGATGTKKFIEPDAYDPNRQIEYVALEGPEPGTYFRGTSRTYSGSAVIAVPEDFSIVSDQNGLTVQLTPVGELATMAVLSQDLRRIVVASSKDVTFHYLVQGIRRAYKDYRPVRGAGVYVPASPQARMPGNLPEEIQRRLIANGTYNADGTVNLATAARAGWTKMWADREAQTQAAAKNREAQSAAGDGRR